MVLGSESVLFDFSPNEIGAQVAVDNLDVFLKASFGGNRSEAGRYAANVRWQNQASEKGTGFISPNKMKDPLLRQGLGHGMFLNDVLFLSQQDSNADLMSNDNWDDRDIRDAKVAKREVVKGIVAGMQNITQKEIENANDALGLPRSNLPNDFGRQEMLNTFAQHFVDQWANTSNDHETDSLMVQEVVKRVFNLEDSATVDTFENFSDIKAVQKDAEDKLKATPQLEKVLTAFVKAQYANTQAYFASKGITEVVVSRGMNHPELAEDLKDYRFGHFGRMTDNEEIELQGDPERNDDIVGNITEEEFDKFVPEGVLTVSMKMRPLSSFSVNRFVADGFRTSDGSQGSKDIGVFLSAKIPVARIFSTPFTGVGCLKEEEFVVLGGQLDAKASRSSAGDEDFDYDIMFPSKKEEIKSYG